MTDKDKQLISQARETSCYRWQEIDDLIAQAETPQAAEMLRTIKKQKYHIEEAMTEQ